MFSIDKKLNYFYQLFLLYQTILCIKMSYRNNNKENSKQSTPLKFCKFCKDSGKHEGIYTSHYTKDKKGVVCCPILMTTLCNNCGNFGHTNKYCKSITMMVKKPVIRVEIKHVIKPKTPMNRYAVFEDEKSDDETEETKEEPKAAAAIQYPIRRRILNWADECSDSDED
jgi:hypothetical protein